MLCIYIYVSIKRQKDKHKVKKITSKTKMFWIDSEKSELSSRTS